MEVFDYVIYIDISEFGKIFINGLRYEYCFEFKYLDGGDILKCFCVEIFWFFGVLG